MPSARFERDWDRADAWLGLAALVLVIGLSIASSAVGRISAGVKALALLAFLAHPYLLLRVIRHFREVPRWWELTLLSLAAVGTLFALGLPSPKPMSLRLGIVAYVAVMQAMAAAVLAFTARKHRGLTAWRLNVASVGAGLFALMFGILVLSAHPATYPLYEKLLRLQRYLALGMVVSYYLGLAPPLVVRRMLQRGEEYRFLRTTAERGPDVRGRLAAADLADAAERSTATASTMVLIGPGPMTIDGASDPALRGLVVEALDGAIGRAVASQGVVNGDVAELEPVLRRAAGTAERFLAVPLRGRSQVWGVLLVTQRRSSLFPADDVAMLRRLCRYTAEIFDHDQLLADERARQQREADARLDLILESLKDHAVITVDNAGLVTSWNVGAEQVFGYAAAEAIGRSVTMLFDDGAPWLMDELQRAGRGEPMIAETMGRRRDDARLTTSVVIRPLQDRGRDSGGFVIVMRDVSRRRLLEDRLRQAHKLEAIGRLAGGVAHDFNNMLTVIIGYAEELDKVVPDEHRSSVAQIRRSGERAASLTRQLLAFSRQQVLRPQVVALPDVVAALMPMLSRLLGEHIEILDVVNPPVPAILADTTQLEQIVMNLAVNARDAMPNGGRLTIRVRAVTLTGVEAASLTGREGVHALLEVTDTGSGMDRATQARMFEPFFTTKDVGRGTGLGLAMVYGAVQQMGGAIAVDSMLDRGTTFRVYVPMHDAG